LRSLSVASPAELRAALAEMDRDSLFRGQTTHYETAGRPAIVSSFDRLGCIPDHMLKWIRYAEDLLDVFLGDAARSSEFVQALLQHYGWRSFHVDCSSSAAVSSWFAAHLYRDHHTVELCEDWEENPVMLDKHYPCYEFVEGEGHLYVIDRLQARRSVGAVDLASLALADARPRAEAQQAWLLGPLRKQSIPMECLVAHIRAPRAVFRDHAAEAGLDSTDRLFPSAEEDPILGALLSLPWTEIALPKDGLDIPAFRRSLDIPEYQESYRKITSPTAAYYRGASVAGRESVDGCKFPGIVVQVPELVLFGAADKAPPCFPKVLELLAKERCVLFEVDALVRHAWMLDSALYQKGVVVIAHEPTLIELCELSVEHPGLELTGAGINKGWYYRVADDGTWSREPRDEQCPCGKDGVHLAHLSALRIVEAYLADPKGFD